MPDDNSPPPAPEKNMKLNMDESDERTHFNKEQVYREVIRPALEQFQKLCQQHEIPMVVALCSSNTEDTMEVATGGSWGPANFVPRSFYLTRALIKDTDKLDRVATLAEMLGLKF